MPKIRIGRCFYAVFDPVFLILESILSNRIRDSSVVVSFAVISFDFPAIFVIKSTDYIG